MFKLVQNAAARKHSAAFLQLEVMNLLPSPSWTLSFAPSRFQLTSIQAENLNPDLQSHSTEQVPSISIRDNINISFPTCQAAALLVDCAAWKAQDNCTYHSCSEGFVKRILWARTPLQLSYPKERFCNIR